MKNAIFKGIGTALITPMTENGSVDYAVMERLVQRQLDANIDALVVCGTTGESSTMPDEEHIEVIRFVADLAKGKTPVIAGTGSNDIHHGAALSIKAREAGADALLCVTPYYNKCTQRGLVESYTKMADAAGIPMIVYNVPGRTGVNIQPATYAKLAEHPLIVGIKEANGNISSVADTMARCGDKVDLYSGNDDQIVPILSLGGIGCISVLSNLLPAETKQITDLWFAGDVAGAAKLQLKYKPLIDALFSEVNPIPIKAAMAAMGLCENYLRLPLTQMEQGTYEHLLKCMREVGLDV